MKLETPFTGKLAVLGQTSRAGHFLALNGTWELRPGAPVKHATRVGDVELYATVIGEIKRLEVVRDHGLMVLRAHGLGTTWLGDLLDEGSHALSAEMGLVYKNANDRMIDAARFDGALLVRADAFGWAGVKA